MEVATVSIIDVIDQLETLVASGRHVPFTPNVVVNEEDVLELIDRARLELPDEIRQARYTVEEQQRLITEAEEHSQRLLATAEGDAQALHRQAQEQAAALVAQHEITRGAEQRAAEITQEAQASASRVRAEADAYVRQVMEELERQLVAAAQSVHQATTQVEDHLDRAAATVRKGIESLPPPTGALPAETTARRRRR
jgi:cell division septum initiation protein DivIVA